MEEDRPRASEPAAGDAEAAWRVSRPALAYRYLFIGILTLLGSVILYAVVPTYRSSRDLAVMVVLGVWVLALLRYWAYLLDMPHKVTLREDGTLAFLSVFRRRIVRADTIVSMKVSPVYPTYLKFRTGRKKRIVMINHLDGLHELVHRIRKANPGLETKGC